MINVSAAKIKNFKVHVEGGYVVVNGWGLTNEAGEYYSADGVFPHTFRSKTLARFIAEAGLTDGAKFVKGTNQ